MKTLELEPYCDDCPYFEPEVPPLPYFDNRVIVECEVVCAHKSKCDYAITANDKLRKMQEGEQE